MKRRKIIILFIAAVVCIAAVMAAPKIFPKEFFILEQYLTSSTRKVEFCKLNEEQVGDLKSYTFEEAVLLPNVEVNQSMLLINKENNISEDFGADVEEYKDSEVYMNRCIMDAYAALAQEVFDRFGEKLYVRSAYRTAQEQAAVIETEGDVATEVNASEHQAGLALDVYVKFYAGMGFIKSEAGQFVNTDCWRYGFIVRYPYYGTKETGIDYEPWHIRYVGAPHAEIIYKNALTLENYIDSLQIGAFYEYGDYIVSRQNGPGILLLENCSEIVISPDNVGNYIITMKK